jgi:hypothetical protein
MSDTVIQASLTSSLAQAFNASSDRGQFKTGMQAPSHAGQYRELFTIQSQSAITPAAANTVSWVLPKAGVLKSAFLRFRFTGASATAHALVFADNMAAAIVESIALSTNSRRLLEIDSNMIVQMVDRNRNKDAYKSLMACNYNTIGYTQPANAAADILSLRDDSVHASVIDHAIVVYCPIPLSPCLPTAFNDKIQLSFTESLQITARIRPMAKYLSVATGGTLPTGIECSLLADICCLGADLNAAVVKQNYKAGSASQMLWERHSKIAVSEGKTPTEATKLMQHKFTINLSTTALLRGLTVVPEVVSNEGTAAAKWTSAGAAKVSRVRLSASGRVIFDVDSGSARFLALTRNATAAHSSEKRLTNEQGVAVAAGTGPQLRGPEALSMHVPLCEDIEDTSKFSGGVAMSGLSSQQLEVWCLSRDATPFHVNVYAQEYGCYSVQSNSGAILSSLSISILYGICV